MHSLPEGAAFFDKPDYSIRMGASWPPPPGARVINYVRDSSINRNDPGNGMEDQFKTLHRLNAQYEMIVVADESEVISGKFTERPRLNVVIGYIERHEAEYVFVAALDRFCRPDYPEDSALLRGRIRRAGGLLMEPGIIYDGDMGDMLYGEKSRTAGQERRNIAGRFQRRRDIRVKEDKLAAGTGPAGYGYAWTERPGVKLKKTAYKLDDTPAPEGDEPRLKHTRAEHILVWLADGWTAGEVREELHRRGWRSPTGNAWWGKDVICYMARNPLYCGKPQADRFRVHRLDVGGGEIRAFRKRTPEERRITLADDTAPAIVTEAVQARAIASLEHNRTARRRRAAGDERWLLADGLIVCAHCELPLTPAASSKPNPGPYAAYYYCNRSRKAGGATCPGVGAVPTAVIDRAAWEAIGEAARDPDKMERWARDATDADLPEARDAALMAEELAKHITLRDRLNAYIGTLPEEERGAQRPTLEEHRAAVTRLTARLASLHAAVGARDERVDAVMRVVANLRRLAPAFAKGVDATPPADRRLAVEGLGLRVTVDDWKIGKWTIDLGEPPLRPSTSVTMTLEPEVRSQRYSDRFRIPLPLPA